MFLKFSVIQKLMRAWDGYIKRKWEMNQKKKEEAKSKENSTSTLSHFSFFSAFIEENSGYRFMGATF